MKKEHTEIMDKLVGEIDNLLDFKSYAIQVYRNEDNDLVYFIDPIE